MIVNDKGPFDIIGDIHGCFQELFGLLLNLSYKIEEEDNHYYISHADNRKLIFLGDLVDRGPQSTDVLKFVMDICSLGKGYCVIGNHDDKLMRYLRGNSVHITNGLELTIQQMEKESPLFRERVLDFLTHLNPYFMLNEESLIVSHAGLKEEYFRMNGSSVRHFCLYGQPLRDKAGNLIREDWAKEYNGKPLIVFGHTPVEEPLFCNNTWNIDTGCVFGGKLTALRYPEMIICSQKAAKSYYEKM